MTSPVGTIYIALEAAMSWRNEAAVFISEEQRRDLLRGVFSGYYRSVAPEQVLFDTNRIWCARLPALTTLFPEARTIRCVRDIAWIIDSIERLVRRNAFELSGLFGFEAGTTVFTRVNRIAGSGGMAGFALDALKEGFFGEHASRMVLVEYEALVRAPGPTMRYLYSFFDEPFFEHDFDHVEYAADAFDLALGAPGMHTVRRKVEWLDRPSILPPELFRRYENDMFWRGPDAANQPMRVIRCDR